MTYASRKNSAKWIREVDEQLPANSKLTINKDYLLLINLLVLKHLFIENTELNKINILFDKLLLSKPVANLLGTYSNGTSNHQRIELIKVLLNFLLSDNKQTTNRANDKKTKLAVKSDDELINILTSIKALLGENIVHNLLKVNEFEGITYFNKEHFEELMRWLLLFELLEIPSKLNENYQTKKKIKKTELDKEIIKSSKMISEKYFGLIKQASECGYDLSKFKKKIDSMGMKKVKPKSTIKKRKTV
jgi:hypothetical protein